MNIIIGKIWKFGDDINTDLIIPSQFLTENDPSIIVTHAFEGIRPGFANQVNKGDIIVGGKNFGSGSSREEAVFVLKELGISLVIAESFSRIYFRNLINLGIPAISLNDTSKNFSDGDIVEINLELGKITNLKTGKEFQFKKLPDFLIEIINEGGVINLLKKRKNPRLNKT